MTDTIINAIETYGKDSQCKMAIEEMSELTKEICKNFRGKPNTDCIAEEIADVKIMLMQLELIFDCTDKVIEWQDYKLRRLKERIENDKRNLSYPRNDRKGMGATNATV